MGTMLPSCQPFDEHPDLGDIFQTIERGGNIVERYNNQENAVTELSHALIDSHLLRLRETVVVFCFFLSSTGSEHQPVQVYSLSMFSFLPYSIFCNVFCLTADLVLHFQQRKFNFTVSLPLSASIFLSLYLSLSL